MGKPDKKLKKILLVLGITSAVYGSFRYLLPLVIPFLIAWGAAEVLRPSAVWISRRCRITVRGRSRGIPVGAVGVAELLVIMAVVGAGFYAGGRKLCSEAFMLTQQVPLWIEETDRWLTALCHRMEDSFCLRADFLVLLMREMLRGLLAGVKKAAMPYLMVNSVSVFRWGVEVTVVTVVTLVSVGLAMQEMEMWKKRCAESAYGEEFALIGRRLAMAASAYLKTQGVIMILTSLICTVGFWMLGSPYYILAGLGIGVLDALPVFGTGTVLIPWAIWTFFCHRWGRGAALLALYLICYFLREILEAKMMGDRVGLSPLETLISMYVGLQLFGIIGFLLGPIGLLLIEDLVRALE